MKEEEIIKDFEESLILRGYKERGIEEKIRSVKKYFKYLEDKNLTLNEIGLREAEMYREYLSVKTTDEGKSYYNPKTINILISHLRFFYRYLVKKGEVLLNPFTGVDNMKVGTHVVKNILTVKQIGKLLRKIEVKTLGDFKFRVIVEVLYATGARISEIEKLKKGDIRVKEGYIIIRDDKNRMDRKVPLTECAVKLLELYMEEVWGNKQGTVFGFGKKRTLNWWVNRQLKIWTEKLNLPKITCHGIRHTIATHLFKSGAGIREVQEYLGHKEIKNTEIYTRVLVDDLKKLIEAKHPREMKE